MASSLSPLLIPLLLLYTISHVPVSTTSYTLRQPDLPSPTPPPTPCPVMLPQKPSAPDSRIVGGSYVSDQAALYMVSLFPTSTKYKCAGVLISKQWVLTAAHCDIDTTWTLRIGATQASKGLVRNISQVFIAEPRGETLQVKDIALVKLTKDAPKNSIFVHVNTDPDQPPVQTFARAVGYGQDNEDQLEADQKLRQVDVPITTFDYCRSVYEIITPDKVCAGYGQGGCDACQGDSGGPLIQFDLKGNPVVVAVVSSGRGCARPAIPGVYMRTSQVIDWMNSVGAQFTIAGKLDHVFDKNPPLSPLPTPSPVPSPSPSPTPSNSPIPTVCPVVLDPHPPQPVSQPRIIGGSLSSKVTAGYMVSLDDRFEYRCAGVLISKRWLLTAAHCEAHPSWIARFGGLNATSGEERKIDKIFIPKQTNTSFPPGQGLSEDIALIRLSSDAPSASTFAKINVDDSLPVTGSFVRAVGYGRTNVYDDDRGGGALRQVDIPIYDTAKCARIYDWLSDDRVCAGYVKGGCDSCYGDGGGPLLQFDEEKQPIIMGLTSGGQGCAFGRLPGVYIRVAPYVSWMKSTGAEFGTTRDAVQVTQSGAAAKPAGEGSYLWPEGVLGSRCPVVLPQLPPKSSDRITQGSEADGRIATYMVALWGEDGGYKCAGIRLSQRWVLTAGVTCGVTTNWTATVGQGSTGTGERYSVVRVYNAGNSSDIREISLVHLSSKVPREGRFARVNADRSTPVAGSFARVMGYGSTDVSEFEPDGKSLRQVDLPVVSAGECREAWDASFVMENLVCAGYKVGDCGICWGDEGGPLVQFDKDDRVVVVGVAYTNVECGRAGAPGLYVRTSSVIDWMKEVGARFKIAESTVAVFGSGAKVDPRRGN